LKDGLPHDVASSISGSSRASSATRSHVTMR
jgi:hypothetical protein